MKDVQGNHPDSNQDKSQESIQSAESFSDSSDTSSSSESSLNIDEMDFGDDVEARAEYFQAKRDRREQKQATKKSSDTLGQSKE